MKTNSVNQIIALAVLAAVAVPLVGFARPPGDRQPPRSQPPQERFEPHRRPPQAHRDHHRQPPPHFRPRPYASVWTPYPPPPPPIYYGGYYYPPPPPPPPPAYYYPCRPGFNVVFTF